MVEEVNVLASSHNHNKITTKLQNNHHWESPKSSWTEVLQLRTYRSHRETDRRGTDTERAVPDPRVAVKIKRGSSAIEVPPEETGVPTPGFSAGKRSPYNFWLKTSGDCGWDKGQLQSQVVLLKGLCMDLLTDRLSSSELQHYGSS